MSISRQFGEKGAAKRKVATSEKPDIATIENDAVEGRKAKEHVSIRLSPEVVDWFKGTGRDWQGRINKVLTDYVQRQK